ncbi:MAG: type 1 glutamine amidotransferase [Bdellovibrionales bacterium]|nr:type 1 glutamine amidotransferase [Bdellovibrionales bacterium]
MKISVLQNVDFEGPGAIADWAEQRRWDMEVVRAYAGDSVQRAAGSELLVVLGGPMGVGDTDKFPWLESERNLISTEVSRGGRVLGICLGAQLLASAMGADVSSSPYKEIGWFPVRRITSAANCFMHDVLPEQFSAFHWHGDMFAVPTGAISLAESDGCPNQGFLFGNKALGLQFHLEVKADGVEKLVEACPQDLNTGRFVQTAEKMLKSSELFAESNQLLFAVLDALCEQ